MSLKKVKKVISLLTWQTSLIIASVGFLVASGVLVLASPNTQENIKNKAIEMAKANFSDFVDIEIDNNLKDFDLLVYNLIDNKSDIPLDIDIQYLEDKTVFDLYPGSYKVVIIGQDYYKTIQKDFVVKVGEKKLILKVDPRLWEEEEEEENTEDEPNDEYDEAISDFDDIQSPLSSPISTSTQNIIDIQAFPISFKDRYGLDISADMIPLNEKYYVSSKYFDAWVPYIEKLSYRWSIFRNGQWEEIFSGVRPVRNKDLNVIQLVMSSIKEPGNYKVKLELNYNKQIPETNFDNNTSIAEFTVAEIYRPLPDIIFSKIELLDSKKNILIDNKIESNTTSWLKIYVKTQDFWEDSISAQLFCEKFVDNSYYVGTYTTTTGFRRPDLKSDQFNSTIDVSIVTQYPGRYRCTIKLDHWDEYEERHKNNNQGFIMFDVV
jgi:hypothetical protein